jgi:hypothetical protein
MEHLQPGLTTLTTFFAYSGYFAVKKKTLRSLHCNQQASRSFDKILRSGAFFIITEARRGRNTELGVSGRTEKGSVLQFLSVSAIERNRLRLCRAAFSAVKQEFNVLRVPCLCGQRVAATGVPRHPGLGRNRPPANSCRNPAGGKEAAERRETPYR